MQFFAVLTGKKPAWFCEHGFNRKVDFNKIKLNPKVAEKFDVIKMPRGQLFFVNKKEVLKIIRENKDLYYTALYAKPDESLETVYKKLLQNLQYGLTGHALFGMTLGFPRHSSMIFELEGLIKKQNTDLREDIPLFKEELLKLLASDKSPFKRYLQTTINSFQTVFANNHQIS